MSGLLRGVLLITRVRRLGTGPGEHTGNVIVRTHLSGKHNPITSLLMRGNALGANSVVITNASIKHIHMVAGRGNARLGATNPSIPIRVANLTRAPGTNSMFSTMSSRHLTHRLIRREGRGTGSSLGGTGRGIALSGLFSGLSSNSLGRLGVVIGTSIRNSMRTIHRDLIGLSGSRIGMSMVRNNINTIGRSSIALTRTSNTVVINFGIHPSTITGRATSHRNMSVHVCHVVCSYVRRVRTTVGNVLTPGFHRGVLNATRIHDICGVSGINAITNYCVAGNGMAHSTRVHLIHSKVMVYRSGVSSLHHFGSSIGRISRNCRYNVNLRGCTSVGRNSVFRTFIVRRCESW